MTQPTQQQIDIWESFKAVSQRCHLEVQACKLRAENCALAVSFAKTKGLAANVDVQSLVAGARQVEKRDEQLKETTLGVELGELGLRFRGRDFDIMAPSGTPPDVYAKYQLTGWPIIVAGIVVGAAAIAWLSATRQSNHELSGKLSALTDEMDATLCADPSSPTCAEWIDTKEREGFNRRENLIDQLDRASEGLPNVVKTIGAGLHWGLTLVLIGAAAVFIWDRKRNR